MISLILINKMESKSLISGENAEKKEVKSIGKYENIKADYFL